MNPNLRALLDRYSNLDTEIRTLLAITDGEKRNLTPEEAQRLKALKAQLSGVNEKIVEERRLIEAERSAPVIGGRGGRATSAAAAPAGRRFAEMFPDVGLDLGGFDSAGEFFSTVHNGLADPRLVMAAASGASEGVGGDGGYLVPSQLVAELMDASLEDEIVRPRAAVRPMRSNNMFVAGFNTLNHSSSIGGFSAQWMGEGDAIDLQKGLIRNLTLKVGKLALLTSATNELISDSPYFERELIPMLTKAIGWSLDLAFLAGDGVAKPIGVLKDAALITVNKETGQPADTITWENIKAMYARLHPASLKNAVWVANTTTKVQLLSLVQLVKNVAGTENVGGTWIPVLRDDGKGGFTMLGIPVEFTEKTPPIGDLGDIILADFSQYIVGLRDEMSIDKSGHVGFTKDETYYRGILRADGLGRWNAPMTPKNGSTLSWCVTLQAR